MSTIYIGLGSNLGNKKENIRQALSLLNEVEGITIVKISSFYETEPVGYEDQNWFINAVAQIETSFSPQEILKIFKEIEQKIGREESIRWGPRKIDLDILFYDQLVYKSNDLIIPHPRLHERAFVLVPLAEINKELMHPIYNKSINKLLSELNTTKKVTKI
ncbi:MAG: 2-amino-4-hydroxy-6-hydroxymethyldihydropteridine diphosphokinase [bacterium]